LSSKSSEETRGYLFAFGAYVSWGLLPAYWKLLHDVPSVTVVCHRIIWATLTFLVILGARDPRALAATLAGARPRLPALVLTAILIGGNWLVYIHAVESGQVLQASLGYFITPLVNVTLGALVLGERLSRPQKIAVALAGLGVLQLALAQRVGVPRLALFLALSFGFYGLIRKRTPLDPLLASTVESAILVPIALVYLAVHYGAGGGGGAELPSAYLAVLLVLSGVVTGPPLLWFAEAAKRLPLTTIGIFQYLAPCLQFALAVFAYGEAFTSTHLRAFGCIWGALAIYSAELIYRKRVRAGLA
jgi:chloramphenicol-sensitive protein RarD